MSDSAWPDLASADLRPTIGSLHLWSQVVGKARLMLTPWENHGWHVPFYVSPRGLVTGLLPLPGRAATIEFDLLASELVIQASDGVAERFALDSPTVAEFHERFLVAMRRAGIETRVDPMPTELHDPVRFDRDDRPRDYDPEVARLYWRALIQAHRVFQLFRTRFSGKTSPIHLFWGAFDLAVTRFSGREAPRHPGGAPYLNDAVAREAYSREVSSAGFWPNLDGDGRPSFYSYAYPAPGGFAERTVRPAAARFDASLGEFVLPYASVRDSDDPDAALLAFLQTTYDAAADLGGWDRALLDREQGRLGQPPIGS